jgi:putative ABC transport system permease protein
MTAYVVSRRHREFGVRQALGATGRDIVRLILGETVVALAAGIAVGISLALAAEARFRRCGAA